MRKILITGGAGFIGSNLADHYLQKGDEVVVFDNLSRKGAEKNLEWLERKYALSSRFKFIKGDVRNAVELQEAVRDADIVFHTAAQVAVTTSIEDPQTDFEINSLGTFNLLEAIRRWGKNPILIFTSTNKVYGGLTDVPVVEYEKSYAFRDLRDGIDESYILEFLSPYAASKATAEHYVRSYSQIYGLRSVVFRMSCIYGVRQFGNEDQGWVAHFIISALLGKVINIYGNGKQLRDVLYIDDLINAFELAIDNIARTCGQIYNLGGGPENTFSLLELISILEKKLKINIPLKFSLRRAGDQYVYISDIRKAKHHFNWQPIISPEEGVTKLINWVKEDIKYFE